MADIGKELGADVLLFGKIERRKNGFQVSLKLLDTATAEMIKTTTDIVPFADAGGDGATTAARAFYARLIGAPPDGVLVVRADAPTGQIFLDGEKRAELVDGQARITGIPEGLHRITIEAPGRARYDAQVSVVIGREEPLEIALARATTPGGLEEEEEAGRPGGGWRAAFWIATGATAIGATAWTIEAYRYSGLFGLTDSPIKQDHLDAVQDLNVLLARDGQDQLLPDSDACDQAEPLERDDDAGIAAAAREVTSVCGRGRFHANMTTVLGIATGVTAVAAVFFYYKGYVAPGAPRTKERTSRRPRRAPEPIVRLTPAVSPTTVGAGLAIEF
jgi:hypothetical protein